MTEAAPVLVLTPGEPAGIGPEITLKLSQDHAGLPVVAVADPELLRRTAKRLGSRTEVRHWQPGAAYQPGVLHCFPVGMANVDGAMLALFRRCRSRL